MPNQEAINQLNRAIAAIQAAIVAISGEPQPGDDLVGICVRDQARVYRPKRIVRGLCPACYALLKSRVDAGETTWEDLESKGLASPKGKVGRKKFDLLDE
jgi:hypothetical protein